MGGGARRRAAGSAAQVPVSHGDVRAAVTLGEVWTDRLDARRRSRAGRSRWARRGMAGWTRGVVRGGAVLADRSDGVSGAPVPPLVSCGPNCEPAYHGRPNPSSHAKAADRVPAVLVALRETVLDKNLCSLSQIHTSRRNWTPPPAGCDAKPESYAPNTKKPQFAENRACILAPPCACAGAGPAPARPRRRCSRDYEGGVRYWQRARRVPGSYRCRQRHGTDPVGRYMV